jgi:NDP-sugar pyrophosphorylase family protein
MKALVLCAGRGSRLGELTEHTPKAMIRVAGEPVIARTLRWLSEHGVTDLAINLHHLGDAIEQFVGDGSALGVSVRYSREPELLGSAGALLPLAEFLQDGPFLVVYGGRVFDFDLGALIRDHSQNLGVATIAVFSSASHDRPTTAGHRVEVDRSGRVLRSVPAHLDPDLDLVNAGCYAIEPKLLEYLGPERPLFLGKHLFPMVLRRSGILIGHRILGRCYEIDTPESLAHVQDVFRSRSPS